MPKRTDLKKILLIGSGPIVIGQAAEFDYSGTQACKALREEGFQVVLVNSNPATIMTDPETADRTYIEPITWQVVEKIIAKERPDALLDPRRADGAEYGDGLAQARRAGEVRRRDDRRQRRGHRQGRGPVEVQGRDAQARARGPEVRGRPHARRRPATARRHRPAVRPPAELHDGRDRRRDRLQPRGVHLDRLARAGDVPDPRGADRGV